MREAHPIESFCVTVQGEHAQLGSASARDPAGCRADEPDGLSLGASPLSHNLSQRSASEGAESSAPR